MTMNLFCCMKETSRRIQNFHMKTTKDSTWMQWTIRNAKLNFDSQKYEIPRLAEARDIPGTFLFFLPPGSTAPGIEGLCLVLRRLTYPCRYSDLIPRLGRPVPELSMIYNVVLDYIYNAHGHGISQWNHTILDPVSLERYAEFQRVVYNGQSGYTH